MILAEILELGCARRFFRNGFDDWNAEALRQLVGDLVEGLNAASTRRRRWNDHVERDTPGSNELLSDRANLIEGGCI